MRWEKLSAAVRWFLSLRYVMTSNIQFEKNKMTSTLAASGSLYGMFTKCKEAERRVKFKGNGKRCGEETKTCNEFSLGKAVLQNSYNRKAS